MAGNKGTDPTWQRHGRSPTGELDVQFTPVELHGEAPGQVVPIYDLWYTLCEGDPDAC